MNEEMWFWRVLGPWREKAHRARGECAKPLAARAARWGAGGVRSTQGEAPNTAGCPARTRRVLPKHGDICLQRPALPTAGLNCTREPK